MTTDPVTTAVAYVTPMKALFVFYTIIGSHSIRDKSRLLRVIYSIIIFLSFLPVTCLAQPNETQILWLHGYGGSGISELGNTVTKTNDGGFIFRIETTAGIGTGNIDSFCPLDGYRSSFLKFNSDATTLEWTKCYQWTGDTIFGYMYPTSDNGAIFGGDYYSVLGGGIFLCKENSLGSIVWSHGFSIGSSMVIKCMMPTNDGGYIIGSQSYFADTNVSVHFGSWMDADIFLMKVDSLGNKVWTKVIGGTSEDVILFVANGPNNGYYIGGGTDSYDSDCTGNHGLGDVYIVRLDSNGNIIWHRDLGGTNTESAQNAIIDGHGGIIVAAFTMSMEGDVSHPIDSLENFWVFDLDSNGNIVWNNCYGGISDSFIVDCVPTSICKTSDNSIWIAGYEAGKRGDMDTQYGKEDAWFVHIDAAGNLLGSKVVGGKMEDRGYLVYPLSNGNIFAAGTYDTTGWTFCPNDFNGVNGIFFTEFTPTVSQVSVIKNGNQEISIYPNPCRGECTLDIKSDINESATVRITDLLGATVMQCTTQANHSTPLKIPGPPGLYFVTVTNRSATQTMKVEVIR